MFSKGRLRIKVLSVSWMLSVVAAIPTALSANPIVIDFEGLPDSTILTTQYPGLSFTNAIILTAGISLNEFEFPPHSGVNVASDNGGPMSIAFASPVVTFGGYFTYAEALTLIGFDAMNNQVASATSLFANNEAISGDTGSSPDEFLQITFAGGISEVTINGDPAGGSFALDDPSYTTGTTGATSVPEPRTLLLVALAMACVTLGRKCSVRAVLLVAFRSRGRRVNRPAVWFVALTGTSLLSAAPAINAPHASPLAVPRNTPTTITLTVVITDPSLIVGSVNLLRTDGSEPVILATFHDDGINGDVTGGDGIFTAVITLNESAVTNVHLQASAAFKGQLARVRQSLPVIAVQLPDASGISLSALVAALQANDAATAVKYLQPTDTGSTVIQNLNQSQRARLASAFGSAQLIQSVDNVRVYQTTFVLANGNSIQRVFTMVPDANGTWVVASW
jgi:hypothetical protein